MVFVDRSFLFYPNQLNGGVLAGRRDQDTGSLKDFSSSATSLCELDTPRRPLTPLVAEDSMPSTPSNTICIEAEEELMTPMTMPLAPKTPTTACTLMQMAVTHAPATEAAGVMEHSFEERRLALLLMKG